MSSHSQLEPLFYAINSSRRPFLHKLEIDLLTCFHASFFLFTPLLFFSATFRPFLPFLRAELCCLCFAGEWGPTLIVIKHWREGLLISIFVSLFPSSLLLLSLYTSFSSHFFLSIRLSLINVDPFFFIISL